MRLRLPKAVLDEVRRHAEEAAPDEACGALAGRFAGEGDLLGRDREVARAVRMRNAHPRPRGEYLLDPVDLLRVTDTVEGEGLDVVGFYHSHPAGPPRLSATDAARATWPGATYLLVWLRPETGHGAWRWDEGRGRFVGEEIVVV